MASYVSSQKMPFTYWYIMFQWLTVSTTYISVTILNESIQTPDPGINFDSSSVVKSTLSKDDPALGWFKTMIQRDTALPISWPDYSQGGRV